MIPGYIAIPRLCQTLGIPYPENVERIVIYAKNDEPARVLVKRLLRDDELPALAVEPEEVKELDVDEEGEVYFAQ